MYREYHKGQLCIHGFILCQEGFCHACAIHQKYQRQKALADDMNYFKKLFKAVRREQFITS